MVAQPVSVPGEIVNAADRFNRRIDRQDTESLRRLAAAYANVVRGVSRRLADAEAEIVRLQSEGKEVRPYRLNDLERYRILILDAATRFHEFGVVLGDEVNRNVRATVAEAEATAQRQLRTAYPRGSEYGVEFHRLPHEAMDRLVGALSDDSPLRSRIDSFGEWGASRIEQSLIQSLARGINPRVAFNKIRSELDFGLTRAATILRTESMRAAREGSRAIYQENNHLVNGWVWHSATDVRTCAACWAMHGTVFPLDTPMGSHPNCRCSMIPQTKTWDELGFPGVEETRLEVPSGEWLFRSLSDADKRRILGRRMFDAYRSGDVKLSDVVRTTTTPEWGVTRTVAGRNLALTQAQTRRRREDEEEAARIERNRQERLAAQEADAAVPEWLRKVRSLIPTNKVDLTESRVREIGGVLRREVVKRRDEAAEGWKKERDEVENRYNTVFQEITSLETQITDVHRRLRQEYPDMPLSELFDLPEYKSLNTRYEALTDEAKNLRRKLHSQHGGATGPPLRQHALEVMHQVRPHGDPKDTHTWEAGSSVSIRKGIDAEAVVYPKDWWDASRSFGSMKAKKVKRGYYWFSGSPVMAVSTQNQQATTIHEIGHRMEHVLPLIPRLEGEFYDRRTAGESLEWMGPGYEKKEVTRKDQFINAYIGKDYAGQFYEVLTMGAESIYAEQPRYDITRDEDFFDFILGILASV